MKKFNTAGIQRYAKKNGAAWLIAFGISGMVVSMIFAVKNTGKAIENVAEMKKEVEEERKANLIDYAKVTWKQYLPSVLIFAGSTVCIICAHRIETRKTAAAMTACKVAETAFREHKVAAEQIAGKRTADKITEQAEANQMKKATEKDPLIEKAGPGDTLFYDPWTGRSFTGNIDRVRMAVKALRAQIELDGYACYNDLFDIIGLDGCKTGELIGWSASSSLKSYLEFTPNAKINSHDQPVIIMHFNIDPEIGYDTPW